MLTTNSSKMKSMPLSTKVHETAENKNIASDGVHVPRSEVQGSIADASVLRKRKCLVGNGGCLARDEVQLLLQQLYEEMKGAERAVSGKPSHVREQNELFREEWLASSVNCVGIWMRANEVQVFHWDRRTLFVRSGLLTGRFCSSLDEYDRALNKLTA